MKNWRTTFVSVFFASMTMLVAANNLTERPIKEWLPYVLLSIGLAANGIFSKDGKNSDKMVVDVRSYKNRG